MLAGSAAHALALSKTTSLFEEKEVGHLYVNQGNL